MNRSQWNRLGRVFAEEVCDIVREESDDQLRRYVAAVHPSRERSMLADLGCGVGTFIERFGHRFKEIVGVEFAATTIAQAKVRCAGMKNVSWLTLDIPRAVAGIGRRADLAVCLNVITSPSAAKRAILWQSLADVTKSGGHALLVVPSFESEAKVQAVIQGRKKPKLATSGGLVVREEATQKHFEEGELRQVLADSGFVVVRLGKAHYSWSIEGLRETAARAAARPWDWICLARRI